MPKKPNTKAKKTKKSTKKTTNVNTNKNNINININTKTGAQKKRTNKKHTNKNVVSGESTGGLSGPDNRVVAYNVPTHSRISLIGEPDYSKLASKISGLLQTGQYNSGLITNQPVTQENFNPAVEKPELIEKSYYIPTQDPDPKLLNYESIGNQKFSVNKTAKGKLEFISNYNGEKASVRDVMKYGGVTEGDIKGYKDQIKTEQPIKDIYYDPFYDPKFKPSPDLPNQFSKPKKVKKLIISEEGGYYDKPNIDNDNPLDNIRDATTKLTPTPEREYYPREAKTKANEKIKGWTDELVEF